MIGVVERCGSAGKGRVVEAPRRRPQLPQDPVEFAAVLRVAGASSLGLEIELPPEWNFAVGLRGDQCRSRIGECIAVARHQPCAALGPEGGDGTGRLAAPVVSRQHGARQRQCVEQRQQIRTERREFARTKRACVKEACGAEAAQIGDDHPATRGRQDGGDFCVGLDVIREAVQKHHRGAVRRPCFVVGDVQDASIDVLQVRQGQGRRSDALRECHLATEGEVQPGDTGTRHGAAQQAASQEVHAIVHAGFIPSLSQ
ncbi:hypothetical protein D9M72_334140 [compost metagenome]